MKLHLPKMLLTALLASFMPMAYAADSISINFTHGNDSIITDTTTGELGGVAASGWNNVAAGNTNGTVVYNQSGTAAGTISISNVANSWQSTIEPDGTVTGVVQRGYIDVPNSYEKIYTISANAYYWFSDVTFYMSADTVGNYAPIKVNGTAYIGGTNTTGDEAWGSTGNPAGATEYNDTNSINVTGVFGTVVAQNIYTYAGGPRATLAGMQIEDATANNGYHVQLAAGTSAAAAQTWTHGDTSVAYSEIAAGNKYLGVHADTDGSTISFENGEAIDSLAALSNKVTVNSDGVIVIKDLYTAAGAEAIINTRVEVTDVRNYGSLKVDSNGVLAFKNSSAVNTIMNATGTGVIETYKDTVLQGTHRRDALHLPHAKPAFEGTIAVKGGTLVVGDNSQWNGHWGIDLSALKSIDLDGGNMKLFGSDSDISVINVKQNAAMNIWEATAIDGKGFAIEKIQLDANLSSYASWSSTLAIGKLAGTGDISFSRGNYDYYVNIGSIDGCGVISNGVTMNIGADEASSVNLSNTIINTGTLSLNGSIVISDNIDGFTMTKVGELGELSVNGTDGYQTTTGSTYLLVDNNGGNVSMTPTTATYKGSTTKLTQDEETGDVTFVGGSSMDTIYRVNTEDITIGGSNATADTGRATGVIVASNRTATIAGDSDTATAAELLLNSTGVGNIKLTTDVKLYADEFTQATGTLTVSGSHLELAGGNDNMASICTFSFIEFDNANVTFNNNADTFHNVTVSANGSNMELFDMGDSEMALTFAGTTTLNGNLNVTSTWNSQMYIEKMAGKGNFVIDDAARSEVLNITIAGSDQYSGQVQVKQSHANLILNVAENAGINVVFTNTGEGGLQSGDGREIKLQGIKAGNTVTLNGVSGFLSQNVVVDADVVLLNTDTKAALEINNGYAAETNKFTGSVSGTGNFLIDKNTTAVHLTYQFDGDVSGWKGKMEIVGGEHDVVYTDANIAANKAIIVNNSVIHSRTNGNANVTFDYTRAATVNSAINNNANGMHLTVKNSSAEGTTFTSNSITLSQLTVDNATKATFTGIESLTLAGLNMKDGACVVIGAQEAGTITAATAKMAGGSTIKGNLDLSTATALTLDFTNNTPITITGVLAMELGTTLTLDGNVLAAINGLALHEKIDLFSVGNFTMGGALPAMDTAEASNPEYAMNTVFAGEWDEGLYLGYDSQQQLVYVVKAVPEPTTATLSLLALAALAARRRRK